MPTVATMNQPYNLPPEQLFECFERFLPAERDPESCWIWRGANTGNGYGGLYIDGRRVRAHRFSYEIAHNIKLSPDVRCSPASRAGCASIPRMPPNRASAAEVAGPR